MIAGGVGGMLLTGCAAADLPLIGPSAQDLASGAASSVTGAERIEGTFVVDKVTYTVDVALAPRTKGGAISGTGTYDKAKFLVVATGGHTYFKGADFWARVPDAAANDITRWPGFGSGWVIAGDDDAAATAMARLYDLGGLVERLGADAKNVKRAAQTTRGGTAMIPVTDRGVTYYVTSDRPYRLRAVESRDTGTPLQALAVDVTPASRVGATAPPSGQFVDPTDPTTLPALYHATTTSDLQNCDENTCGFTATIENTTGPPQGQTVATLQLLQQDGVTPIGSCDVAVPALGHGQTADVTCRISGPTYAAFYNSIPPGGSTLVAKSVSLRNPPYNA